MKEKKTILLCCLIAVLLVGAWWVHAGPPPVLEVGKFSTEVPGGTLPSGWKPLTFKKIEKHTSYTLVKEGDAVVVKADARASASGLTREIRIDSREYPIVQWRWRVENTLKKGDVHEKEGDDYPARLYIAFEYDPSLLGFFEKLKYEAARLLYGQYPPVGAINYIWESSAPVGTFVPNPYTDRVVMIVVESGEARLHQWISEERNIYEDYRKAFGKESSHDIGCRNHDGYRQYGRIRNSLLWGYCVQTP